MKKNLRKSKDIKVDRMTDSKKSSNLDFSLDDSLDEIFRFDDKLIGKRTNAIFQAKPLGDGLYDIDIKSTVLSNFSSYHSASYDSYNVDEIDDLDEKKNEKMIRVIKEIEMEASNLSYNDLSKLQKLFEEEESQKQETLNIATQNDKNGEKSFNSKELPTVEKKNQTLQDQENPPQIDDDKSTKSKQQSQKKGKVKQKSNKLKVKQNQDKRKTKLSNGKNDSKMNQINEIFNEGQRQTTYQRMKRQQRESAQKLGKRVTEKNKKRLQQPQTKNEEKIVDKKHQNQQHERHNQTPVRSSEKKMYSRKRLPGRYDNPSQEERQSVPKLRKFEVKINFDLPTMQNARYPQRLRIPPLRGWQNQKRNFEKGFLRSIILIDDSYGREIQKTIKRQKERSVN